MAAGSQSRMLRDHITNCRHKAEKERGKNPRSGVRLHELLTCSDILPPARLRFLKTSEPLQNSILIGELSVQLQEPTGDIFHSNYQWIKHLVYKPKDQSVDL